MKTGIALVSLLVCAGVLARADDAAVKKAIQSQYGKMAAAYKKGDVKGVTAQMLPDCAKSETSYVKNNMGMMKISDVGYKITAMKVTGDDALVFVNATFTGSAKNSAGKKVSGSVVQKSIDTWKSTPKAWMLKRSASNGMGGGLR